MNNHMLNVLQAQHRTLDFHIHGNSDELFYCIEGEFDIEFEYGLTHLREGDFIIIPKGTKHRPICNTLVKCLLIEVEGTLNRENTGGTKPCYVIVFLPQKISKTANRYFFDVEYYLFNSEKCHEMKNKYVNIILKLMCYYHTSVLWNRWDDNPEPEDIDAAVSGIMGNYSGTLNILFPEENVLLVFEWDCLNLAAYNLSESNERSSRKDSIARRLFLL